MCIQNQYCREPVYLKADILTYVYFFMCKILELLRFTSLVLTYLLHSSQVRRSHYLQNKIKCLNVTVFMFQPYLFFQTSSRHWCFVLISPLDLTICLILSTHRLSINPSRFRTSISSYKKHSQIPPVINEYSFFSQINNVLIFVSVLCCCGTRIIWVSRSNDTATVTQVKMTVICFWYHYMIILN